MLNKFNIDEVVVDNIEMVAAFEQCPECESYNIKQSRQGYSCDRCKSEWELAFVERQ